MSDPLDPVEQARREFAFEMFRAAVETEKVRLRTCERRSLLRRLVDAIPFTITWKKK